MATEDRSRREQLASDSQGIYQHLAADHRKIESLFDELASADGDVERIRELHVGIKRELMLHTNVEDRVVYTPIESYEQLESAIGNARDEHQQADQLLVELDGLEVGGQAFMDKAKALRQALESHISEEENNVIPAAFDVLDERASREMARTYESEKETELATLMETEPGLSEDEEHLEELSREDLIELARQRDIEGRSQMNKEELAQALRQHR